MKRKFTILIIILSGFFFSVEAEHLKKVMILEYNNIDKDSNFNYLESSIADTIREMLRQKFAFVETPREDWQKVTVENFIFKEDYFTKSVSINLGLLAKQDIVISGEYRIAGNTAPYGEYPTTNSVATIIIHTAIYDISSKKILSEFVVSGPASSDIFGSLKVVASRVAEEAKRVLPNKEDWQKKGLSVVENKPAFTGIQLGIRGGAGFYALGYAPNFTAKLPSFSVFMRSALPVIWSRLALQIQFDYFGHTLNRKTGGLALANIAGETVNYIPALYFGIIIPVPVKGINTITIFPRIGAGYVFQTTNLTGDLNQSFNNSFFGAGAGADIVYEINTFISAGVSLQSIMEVESETITLFNHASLGINFKM